MKLALPLQGIVLAVIAAAGQGICMVISKYGMKNYDPFSSAQIRVFAGFIGFALLFTILRKWNEVPASIRNRKAMLWLVIGSIFGPFLWRLLFYDSCSAYQCRYCSNHYVPGASVIIPPAIMITGVWPKMREIIGALLAVAGVSLFFI